MSRLFGFWQPFLPISKSDTQRTIMENVNSQTLNPKTYLSSQRGSLEGSGDLLWFCGALKFFARFSLKDQGTLQVPIRSSFRRGKGTIRAIMFG